MLFRSQERAAWPTLRIEHVEADGVGDAVMQGESIMVRAYVNLGSLTPDDVDVQVVFGRVDADDRLADPQHASMAAMESFEGNRWQFGCEVALAQNGPFGYTVRILPKHPGLATPEEMGLQVTPPETAGMSDGVLR